MLPRSNRMVNPADFRLAIRSGSRAGQQRLIVHCRTDEDSDSRLVGFVVPKSQIKRAVGRNRVKRQLRHLMKERLGVLPQGARVVVRVKHDALGASSCELGEELDQVLRRAWKKWDHREGGRP
ncbi:MAG: ribonuclease P protein component [Actinomyces sp.]|nr:ribonuclease P protein component [Actinomyces sp.]